MSEPKNNRGRSKQDYATPRDFIGAVVERFGTITFDLAASPGNHVAPAFLSEAQDALTYNWGDVAANWGGNLWLNPPYGNITKWVAKTESLLCPPREWSKGRLLMLVPASVGSNWYADHVHGKASVYFLRPRLTFVGCIAPFPKDLMLLGFGKPPKSVEAPECWRWK